MANKNELIDSSIALPTQTYLVFIEKVESVRTKTKTDPKTGRTRGNDPMAKFSLQIVAPDFVETPEGKAQAAGRTIDWYLAFTPRNATPVKQAELLLGRAVPDTYDEVQDIILPLSQLAGNVFEAELKSVPYFETDNGRYDGKVLLDERGQPKVKGHKLEFNKPLSAISPLPEGVTPAPF